MKAVKNHGANAIFALVETVAYIDGHIPRKDGGIKWPNRYISGILNKPQEDQNPYKTLETWLACERAEAAKAKRAAADQAKADRQKLLDDKRTRFRDFLYAAMGEDQAQMVEPELILERITKDTVVYRAKTRLIRDLARAEAGHYSEAWAKATGDGLQIIITDLTYQKSLK